MDRKKVWATWDLRGSPHLPPTERRIAYGEALVASLATAVLVFAVLGLLLWKPARAHLSPEVFRYAWAAPPAIVALILSLLVWRNATQPRDLIRHIDGRQYDDSDQAAARCAQEMARQIELDGGRVGIQVAPGIPISQDRETKGFFYVGAPGGGKTVAMKWLLEQALCRREVVLEKTPDGRQVRRKRADRIIVFDPKGDYYDMVRGLRRHHYYFAPWSEKSFVVDFGKDIRDKRDAWEFASEVISSDRGETDNWTQGARQLLVGLIVTLQCTKETAWTIADLRDYIASDTQTMRDMLEIYYPLARTLIENDNKATESYLSMLRASTTDIDQLADDFARMATHRVVSLTEWVRDENPRHKVIILAGSKKYQALMRICARFAIRTISNEIGSLPDSRDRRIWFFLDEFPQLGKLDDIIAMVEFSRSKGVRVAIGTQDISQIAHLYKRERSDSIMSMMSTKIVCNVSGGNTADELSKALGTRVIERPNTTVTYEGGQQKLSTGWQRETMTIVNPSNLTTDLGKDGTGIYAILDILNAENIYRVHWPFRTYPPPVDQPEPKVTEQLTSAPSRNASATAQSPFTQGSERKPGVASAPQAPFDAVLEEALRRETAEIFGPIQMERVRSAERGEDGRQESPVDEAVAQTMVDLTMGHSSEVILEAIDALSEPGSSDKPGRASVPVAFFKRRRRQQPEQGA